MADYNTFVPIFPYGSWLFTRVSGQVYLERSDFEWLAGVLYELCEEVARKEYQHFGCLGRRLYGK